MSKSSFLFVKPKIGLVILSYADGSEKNNCSIVEIFLIETSRGMGI